MYVKPSARLYEATPTLSSFLHLIRISNWVKNLVIFFPLFFGKQLINSRYLTVCLSGFIGFCLLTSAVYIMNDIADVESDTRHPTKKNRPLASGRISLSSAYLTMAVMLVLAFSICFLFLSPPATIFFLLYFIVNVLYTFQLKSVGLLDIFLICFFFEIRLFLGGILAHVEVSHWLSMLTFFLAAFVAFSKRHDDVTLSAGMDKDIRKSVKDYNIEYLNMMLLLLAAVLLIIYVLYAIADTGGGKYSANFYQTAFFVFLGICRYLQLILVHKKSDNPVKIFYSDKVTFFACIGWVASVLYFVYF